MLVVPGGWVDVDIRFVPSRCSSRLLDLVGRRADGRCDHLVDD